MAYQIYQPHCSCCHRCRVLCPMNAISFKGAKYWIDPEKCVECGLCAANCHNGAISLIGAQPELPAAHEPRELECDVAVIGAGGSGLVSAVRLAEMGKSVIVLEKNREIGGNTWFASGFMIRYSRLHREAGLPDTREQALESFLKATDGLEDPVLARKTFYATEDFGNWLFDNCGCAPDFKLKEMHWGRIVGFENVTGKKYKRIDASIGPGGMGSYLIEKLEKRCAELGVRILVKHEAKHLLRDGDGAVCGVAAHDGGGEVIVHAKAVIMAAGCFSHNPEYLARANPEIPKCEEPIHYFSVPTCTGDGITMGMEIGAKISWDRTKAMILGPAHHPFSFAAVCISREPEVLLVNRDGKRWASEVDNTMGLRDVILEQPGRMAWAIFDQSVLDTVGKRLSIPKEPGDEHAEIIQHYQREIDEETLMDMPAKKADTPEELAVLMGVDPETFAATLRRYNELCHAGSDADFGKPAEFMLPMETGPYYALYEKLFQENAGGGLTTDSDLRVLDENGRVIPRLYAVGDNSTGLMLGSGEYSETVEQNVSMFTWAVASGYMVPETVAADLE